MWDICKEFPNYYAPCMQAENMHEKIIHHL